MKFKREQDCETIPPVGILEGVSAVSVSGFHFQLAQVAPEMIETMRESNKRLKVKKTLGLPTYCALRFVDSAQILEVYPAPEYDIEIKVRYFPPMKEA